MDDGFIQLIPKKYSLKKKFTRTSTQEIVLSHGHIAITNYKMGDNRDFEKSLSVWDGINFKYRFIGGYYVKALKELRINRGYDLHRLKGFFPNLDMRVENDSYPADKIDIDLLTGPKDDFQRVALTFMVSEGEYFKNKRYTQQMVTAPTGSGKSFLGIASSAYLRGPTVIFVPFAKLLKQWKESFINFTSLTEDEIMIVQGSKDCLKILEGKCKKIKVFIFMMDTVVSFNDRYGDMDTMDMLHATRAHTKIVDEVHRDMKALSMVEALSNFRMNYYLSASPGRTETKEDWIFRTLFTNVPKFGKGFETQDEKHLNIMVKKYEFLPTPRQINAMVNPKTGLNVMAYERELLAAPDYQRESFEESLKVMLRWCKGILVKGNKILILAKTVSFITYIQTITEDIFPGQTSLYHGQLKPKEKEKALEADIIIATSQSLGTGADIPGLQHCINCCTYSSKIEAIQTSGRVRKLKDKKTEAIYIEMVNAGWRKTLKQYEKRKPFLLQRSKTGKIITIS